MNNPLAQLDLDRFRIDAESFVGQAIELGIRFEKLPPQISDALLAFLRAKGIYFGKRNRAGIAISRESLERGVRHALICMDLGLNELAEGDLNRAVDLLAEGDFEGFRKKGYELAFFRLEAMREEAQILAKRPEISFLSREGKDVQHWAALTPETWICPSDEEDEEPQQVDPRTDYAAFQGVKARIDFLRSVPREALEMLQTTVKEDRAFDGFLRNLILALALGLDRMLPNPEDIDIFEQTCFEAGKMKEAVHDKVLFLVERQLNEVVEPGFREIIQAEVEAEIEVLEGALGDFLSDCFLKAGRASGMPSTVDALLGEVDNDDIKFL